MDDLYSRINELCLEKAKNMTEMCREADVPRGNLTDLKKGRQSGLSSANLNKIANYFNVPIVFLLSDGIFADWDDINRDRRRFIDQSEVDPSILSVLFGIDSDNPECASISLFTQFLNLAVDSASRDEAGNWIVRTKEHFKSSDMTSTLHLSKKEKALAVKAESETQSPAFFRLKEGLEPYDLSEADADFLLAVYKAHITKNRQG